jgi:uncharacterized protein YndB with AHSA1/START domain
MANVYVAGSRAITRSILIGAPLDDVWRAIATPEGLVRWFAHRAEPTPTGFRLEWDRPSDVDAVEVRLRESRPGSKLVFDWDSTVRGRDTRATFVLTAEGDATRLIFLEEGFGDGPEWDRAIAHIGDGWEDVLPRLPELWPVAPSRAIHREVLLPGTAAAAYHALTDEAELARWLAPAASFDPRRGGAWRLDAPAFSTPCAGRVVGLEPDRRIRLAWSWYRLPLAPTEVELGLADAGAGVRLTLAHAGLGHGETWDAAHDDAERGWTEAFAALARHLAPARV